ncbi:MAG: hypothetical protein H6831_06035 [Planctomycetes bacterium]|nr:hypothetical protein [Planctomycetota bacterium]MCB9903951.1 hypothetical protein [Planctomycetota bacterium]
MKREWLGTVPAASAYGFALGSAHSLDHSLDNLVKFPLLIGSTAVVCGIGYTVTGRFLIPELSPADVRRATAQLYNDLTVLLLSLCPVTLFMGLILARTDEGPLGEYDLFLRLNIIFVAVCGALALARQWRQLMSVTDVGSARAIAVLCVWLALSALAGGQASFYLRPLLGMPFTRGMDVPFILGTEPTARGARNFFEVVWFSLSSPDVPEDVLRGAEPRGSER